jgi:hypothetical protein
MSDQHESVYSSSFVPVPRQKVVAFWSMHQVIIGLATITIYVLRLVNGTQFISMSTLILGSILVLDLINIRNLSIWQYIGIQLGFVVLQATGKSKATISPLTVDTTVADFDIPGNEGQTTMHKIINTEYDGACFIWDSALGQATATLWFRGISAQLASAGQLNQLATKFSAALSVLAEKPDVVRVTFQPRSLMKPTPVSSDDVDTFVDEDIHTVETAMIPSAPIHDYIATITVNPLKTKADLPSSSKPSDISRLLSVRVEELAQTLQAAGIDSTSLKWVNMQEMRGLIKTMVEPNAYSLLDEEGRLPDDVPLALSWRVHPTYMEAGSMYARTRWIDHMPKDRVASGWLDRITASPDIQVILTQVFRSRDEKHAKKSVEGQLNETSTMMRMNNKLGRLPDQKTVNEVEQLTQQLRDISKDNGDIQFKTFVTILSPSLSQLDEDCRTFDARCADLIHLDPMRNQQLARFTGTLPLGLEGR